MILNDKDIREAITNKDIIIDPFDDSLINPTSLDVRLGGHFSYPKTSKTHNCIDPLDKSSFEFIKVNGDTHILPPNGFICASLLEDLTLSTNISARVVGKSSLARLGIDCCSPAGWVDAAWSGLLVVELKNLSSEYIKLTKGMKIGQLLFYKHLHVDKGYNETGRYFKQLPGQGSLGVTR